MKKILLTFTALMLLPLASQSMNSRALKRQREIRERHQQQQTTKKRPTTKRQKEDPAAILKYNELRDNGGNFDKKTLQLSKDLTKASQEAVQETNQEVNETTKIKPVDEFEAPVNTDIVVEENEAIETGTPEKPVVEIVEECDEEHHKETSQETDHQTNEEVEKEVNNDDIDTPPTTTDSINEPATQPTTYPPATEQADNYEQSDIFPDFYAGVNSCSFHYDVERVGVIFAQALRGTGSIVCTNGQKWNFDIAGGGLIFLKSVALGYMKEAGDVVFSFNTGKAITRNQFAALIGRLQVAVALGDDGFVGGAHAMISTGVHAQVGVIVGKTKGLGVAFGTEFWALYDKNDPNSPNNREKRRRECERRRSGFNVHCPRI